MTDSIHANAIDAIKSSIRDNELKKAVAQVQDLVKNWLPQFEDEIMLHASKANQLAKEERIGMLDRNTANQEKAKLGHALLQLVGDIEKKLPDASIPIEPPKSKPEKEKTDEQVKDKSGKERKSYKYQVALSFCGSDRKYAHELAKLLTEKGISVFYDEFEQSELWGKDLYQYLQAVYKDHARYCVIFVSKAYSNALWTKHELKQAQARAFRESKEYILPLRLDDTEIPGMTETVAYLDLRSTSISEVATVLLKKLSSL